MNKEVIYLEPEDDITDILTKLQRAEQKLVALVPPKKAAMFHSAVNMKLVARAAKESKKVAVIVTSDPAVVKLAMAAQIPVAKNLQSRPVVPTPEMVKDASAKEQVIDEDLAENPEKSAKDQKSAPKSRSKASESDSKPRATKNADVIDLNDSDLEEGSKTSKKPKNKDKKDKNVPKIEKYRKWIVLGAVAAVLLIVFGVWALVFAPAAKITVAMHTSSSSFSEPVSFTTDQAAENLDEGKFYVEKQTYEEELSSDISPTGKEDRGDKATGKVVLSYTFTGRKEPDGFSFDIPSGTEFIADNGLAYRSTAAGNIAWNGDFPINCDSGTVRNASSTCTLSATVPVEATASGEKYNISSDAKWNSYGNNGITVANSGAISGGTSHDVSFISQADVDRKKEEMMSDNADMGKEKLFADIDKEKFIVIEGSYGSEATDVTPKPSVGEEIKDDSEPTLSVKASYYVYTIPKEKIASFIDKKTSVGEDQKIYSIGDPYFERFSSLEDIARLKTNIKVGPTVTEENIIERAKGRKIGEIQSLLRSINGVSSVNVSPSYFWVRTIPNDPAKITVDLTVEDNE